MYLIEAISTGPASVLLVLINRKVHLKGIHPLTAHVTPAGTPISGMQCLFTQLPTHTLHTLLMTLSDTPVAVLRDFIPCWGC